MTGCCAPEASGGEKNRGDVGGDGDARGVDGRDNDTLWESFGDDKLYGWSGTKPSSAGIVTIASMEAKATTGSAMRSGTNPRARQTSKGLTRPSRPVRPHAGVEIP
jgi:hypothetical protein